ncbi:contractile injection system protein, VgrG/Pvc8 family [Aquibium sp. ELW1220]|uniref:phage late control D family protein n=1 Tax=Aquibium sp. ELW1220 TaxID=2976766 RepID=UPI0025B03772|nr:contractile injection system protein, VgrG/Pvc8 family [Aquibium sp. ELW1220]MDN2582981.1 contractile injection system protein, VgrG/Pvc8 family [Aquibium sp. ELW1220]
MSKRAIVSVTVAGSNITSTLLPVLISLSVSDKVGTHADTATLAIDDSNGRIILPQIGAPVTIALGWAGAGVRVVFEGTVDEVKSSGSRGAGRMLTITAKGVDTTAPPKQGQQRHFDDSRIEDILTEAGKVAGITSVEVDPELGSIRRAYVDMRDESFVHLGERLAREIGGNFRIQGTRAMLSKRDGNYTAAVTATWGVNLHAWDIAPQLGRTNFSAIRTRWYDTANAEWKTVETATGLDVDATYADRLPRAGEDEANQQNASDQATTKRDKGGGSVTIEGNTEAIPDGLCIILGARPGIDGDYRIDSVTHTFSRGAGFVSQVSLKQPGIG